MCHHLHIRQVRAEDVDRLLEIYDQSMDTFITFEFELPSREVFLQRIETISEKYPYLVCEQNGRIVGYAYAHEHINRAAYQWNAELTVYIDQAAVRQGIGRRLYGALMAILQQMHIKNVYGCVTADNKASNGLHEALGFSLLGTFHNTGYKCGRWLDVHWFEKSLAPYEVPPQCPCSIREVDPQVIEDILRRFSL